MVQSLVIRPAARQKAGELLLPGIRINQYSGNVASELSPGRFLTPQTAIGIYLDMYTGRRVEEALHSIKTQNKFGIEGETPLTFDYGGPAHLRIGQEADAVGKTFLLKPDEVIFGSHGSHLEIIAKAMAAIHQLEPAEAFRRLEAYHDGELTSRVAKIELSIPAVVQGLGINSNRDQAINAFLYGLAAEIFCKNTGFNRGLGGSMHAFFLPFGIGPNNAIVGSSANIAAGAAYAELIKNYMEARGPQDFNRVMFNVGDGAAARGPVLETLNFMGMAQIKNLWNLSVSGLPLIGHFVDNGYGMGGQTTGETASYERLVQLFCGNRPDGYHAETINGNDPLAVIDFYYRNFQSLSQTGDWPLAVHSETYRLSGHSPSDASKYRTTEEVEAWRAVEPLGRYKAQLISALKTRDGFGDIEKQIAGLERYVDERIYHAFRLAIDPQKSPPAVTGQDAAATLESYMFKQGSSGAAIHSRVGRDTLKPLADHPYFIKIKVTHEKNPDEVSFREALSLAMMQRAEVDGRVVFWGEDVRDWGGAFAVYRDMDQWLPRHRLFNAPISEGTIVGAAVGAAMRGLRPVVEIMYSDFLGCAGEELINQLAKWQGMSAGEIKLPVGVRVSVGSKYGAQHSQDLFSMLYGIPGLLLAYPATPYDAKTMMSALMMQDNPFVISESQKNYSLTTGNYRGVGLQIDPPPFYETGCIIGDPQRVIEGNDLTILAFGPALYTAARAASDLRKMLYSVDLFDGKWLVPFNFAPLLRSIEKTHRVVLVTEASERGSFVSALAGDLQRLAMYNLESPVGIVGSLNTVTPGYNGQNNFFPSASTILDEIHANIRPLTGYRPTSDRSPGELQRRRLKGV